MEDKDVFKAFERGAKKLKPKITTDKDNYWYLQGNIPLCLVAHIDTVSPIKTKVGRVFDFYNGIIRAYHETSTGTVRAAVLGADDRAGCYGLYRLMRANPVNRPHILLLNYEEVGGIGVRDFVKKVDASKLGVNLFIELDRQGCNHYVQYNDNPDCVHDYIQSFGFDSQGRGSFSDISVISATTKIPSVNLSIGYYRQHTTSEMLDTAVMNMTIAKVQMMIDTFPKASFGKIKEPIPYKAPVYQSKAVKKAEKAKPVVTVHSAGKQTEINYGNGYGGVTDSDWPDTDVVVTPVSAHGVWTNPLVNKLPSVCQSCNKVSCSQCDLGNKSVQKYALDSELEDYENRTGLYAEIERKRLGIPRPDKFQRNIGGQVKKEEQVPICAICAQLPDTCTCDHNTGWNVPQFPNS